MSWISDYIYKIYKIDEIYKIRLIECISLTGGIYRYDKHIAFIKELVTLILHNAVWVAGHLFYTFNPLSNPPYGSIETPLPQYLLKNRSLRSNRLLKVLNPLLESQNYWIRSWSHKVTNSAPGIAKLLNPLMESQGFWTRSSSTKVPDPAPGVPKGPKPPPGVTKVLNPLLELQRSKTPLPEYQRS